MKKQKQRTTTLEQWAEVTVRNGETVTRLFPSNEELRKKYFEMDPKPDLIYRRINFRSCVPVEYHWITGDPIRRAVGGHCIQRIEPQTWLRTSEQEESVGPHIGFCEIMPRPKDRGGCDCPDCTQAAARLEAEANQ